MTAPSDNVKGALYMTLAMAGFAINDAAIKVVLADMPLYPAILMRGGLMALVLVAACWATGGFAWRPGPRDRRLVAWRTVAEVATTLLFLTALAQLPLANANAILQASPLAVTLAAALFLGESVGWRRALALGVGFLGVMIIVRPGLAGFNPYAMLALAAVATITLRDIVTRQFSRAVPTLPVALVTTLATLGVGAIGSAAHPWPAFTPAHLAWLSLSAAALTLAYTCSVLTMRWGEISFIAPFRYTILLWAILLGILIFGDLPDALTLLGAALVVGSGLFTFWRERRLSRVP
ncbi:MAG: DMT family transporter [Pseudomonadota bacterium]